ncbi:MAG: response regulator [Pontiellaceae bacterium]|jgi:CheY-like chemotaxis protein|nr:response regulator [Pontiellaceae bacterium]
MKHILIVDDDPFIQRLFDQFFRSKGFSTAIADNGLSAVLKMKAQVPDLIITDIVMAGMDGLTLIREVRKEYPLMPIIAISGGRRAMEVDYQPHAEKDGASRFLEKPIYLRDLLIAVQALLDGISPVRKEKP